MTTNNQNIANTNKIILKTARGIMYLSFEDIIRFEAKGKHAIVHHMNEQKLEIVHHLLSELEAKVAEAGTFFRIHRSHLVNMQHVSRCERKTRTLVTASGDVPISREFFKEFLERYGT